ncbi:MAG TPA: beta-N-acetylhexosaminidase [Verrucomicrobiae bacterium]|jgi:hexosaminidase
MKTAPLFIVLTLTCLAAAARAAEPAIIPAPEKMTVHDGVFTLTADTPILVESKSKATGAYLAERLRGSTGFPLRVKSSGKAAPGAILLSTKDSDASLGAEGYELTVTPDSVVVRAPAEAGLFYGVQTFLQLLPPEAFSPKPVSGVTWAASCVEIRDQPRFAWRGMLLDVSRHFYTKAEVEKILDALALHKINTLHWHLVDDDGWRIQIKKYPRLTDVGAWRTNIGFNLKHDDSECYGPDGRYGGYYTQKDIREVVRYASERHVTIVPEIEMPGHSSAALAAYPQFSCFGGPYSTDRVKGASPGVYCAGNDGSFVFLENVLKEVFALFPAKYIHVGGDEVPTSNWAKCPKCQARKETEHLQNDRQLESYFIQRMEKFINSRGRSLIGWSEIREGGLAQNATLMDWIGGATEGATAGHDVVMTPEADCYLDHYQSRNHSTEPRAIGGFLPLAKIYAFDPIPAKLAPEYQHHILGAQGNLWTEFIPNLHHAEYMIFPRECALAEVTWSPKDARNFDDFLKRLEIDERRLDALGINYRRNPLEIQ